MSQCHFSAHYHGMPPAPTITAPSVKLDSGRLRINTKNESIYSSIATLFFGGAGVCLYVWFLFVFKGMHVLCGNLLDARLIPHFTALKLTDLYNQMRCSPSLYSIAFRVSVLSIIHFIVMTNPPGIWVYIITSKLLHIWFLLPLWPCKESNYFWYVQCVLQHKKQRVIAEYTASHPGRHYLCISNCWL